MEDNSLQLHDGEARARGTGQRRIIPADAVVFAIGDTVDAGFGLPVTGAEFSKNPEPRFPVEGVSYEAYDPQTKTVIADVFLAGWSRQASSGLVGYARRDGTNGARAVLQYLQTLVPCQVDESALASRLRKIGKPVITRSDVRNLVEIETAEARHRGLQAFKYGTNEEMLAKIMSVG